MKNRQLFEVLHALNKVDFGDVNIAFTIKKKRVKDKIESYLKPIQETNAEVEEELRERALAIAVKDDDGNPVEGDEPGSIKIAKGNEEEEAKLHKMKQEQAQVYEEEADVEIDKLPLSQFPDKLNDKLTEMLLPIIDEEG